MDKFEIFKKPIINYEDEISDKEIEKLLNAVNLTNDLIKKMKSNPLIYPKANK